MLSLRPLALSTILLGLVACSSQTANTASIDAQPGAASMQIARGGEVYAANCAKCHGAAGGGTDRAPLLVGTGSFPLHPREDQERTADFHTALDIAVFATQNMPPSAGKRAKIVESDYWAVLAFALSANGVDLQSPVNADNAAQIVLHP